MGLFSPYKKHAKKFEYKPRFYDPEQEEFNERRAERGGDLPEGEEARPGDRIRMRREARLRRKSEDESRSRRSKSTKLVILLAVIAFAIWGLNTCSKKLESVQPQDTQYSESKPLTESEQLDVVDRVVYDREQPLEITDNDGNPLSQEQIEKMFGDKLKELEAKEKE